MLKEHGMFPAEHLPERIAQTCYFHMSIHFLSSIIYAKEIDILPSKPNVVSVCEGIYRSLFPVKSQLYVVALWLPFYLNDTNARRARCAPNKHYEIPFVRSIPCSSSLCNIQLRTPQATCRARLVLEFLIP